MFSLCGRQVSIILVTTMSESSQNNGYFYLPITLWVSDLASAHLDDLAAIACSAGGERQVSDSFTCESASWSCGLASP